MTLELSEETLARLNAEADRRGVTLDELVAELASLLPTEAATDPHKARSFVGIGSSTSGRSAADADDMLAEGFGRD